MIEILDARTRKSINSEEGYLVIRADYSAGIRLQKSLYESLGWLPDDRVVFGHENGAYYIGRSNDEYAFRVREATNNTGSTSYIINAKSIQMDLVKVLDPDVCKGKYYFKLEPTDKLVRSGSPYFWYRLVPKSFRL